MDQKKACSSNNQQQPRNRAYAFQESPSKQSSRHGNEKKAPGTSQHDVDQDAYNKCVHFAEKSCKAAKQECSRMQSSSSAQRTPMSSSNDPNSCNCQKCKSPGHPCDCAKCRAKKEAQNHNQSLSTMRSMPASHQSPSSSAHRTPMNSSNDRKQIQGSGSNKSMSSCHQSPNSSTHRTPMNSSNDPKYNQSLSTSRSMPGRHQSPSSSAHRTPMSSSNDPNSCNCQKCNSPGHPCNCSKCQAKKEAHNQSSSTNRSMPASHQSPNSSVHRTAMNSSSDSKQNQGSSTNRSMSACHQWPNSSPHRTPMGSSNDPKQIQGSSTNRSMPGSHQSRSTSPHRTPMNSSSDSKHNQGSSTNRSMPGRHQSPSSSAHRKPNNSSDDPNSCDWLKCNSPENPCNCANCQAKKEAHNQSLNTNSSVQSPRTEQSCDNDASEFLPLLSSSQRFNDSRSMELYHPLSSTQRHNEIDQNDFQSNNTCENRIPNSTQRNKSNDQNNSTARPQRSCQCKLDEMPTTSTRTSCNTSSLSTETKRSLMSTELNKTLFHPNSSDKLNRSNMGSMELHSTTKDNESLLVEDTYNPGLIEDCVAGKKDFNAVSFGMFFENTQQIPKSMPEKTPMTLIEAISKRIDTEREHMSDALNCKSDSKGLNANSIDLYFSCKPPTELNEALSCLFKAEVIYNEKMGRRNKTNQTLDNNDTSYDIEVQQTELPLVGGCPITVECYAGTTKLKENHQKGAQSGSKKKDGCIKKD